MKKLITSLTFLLLLSLKIVAQVPSNIPTNGLLAWYNFTGNVLDSSGKGNHLSNTNATLTDDRFGRTNRAYAFDGSSSYLTIGSPSFTFADTSKFSYSIWMKKKNTTGVSIMIGSSAANNFITLLGGGSDTRFGTNKQNSAWVWASTTHNLNQWDHYTCVYNAGAMTLYKNGSSVSTATFSYTNVTSANLPLFIGKDIGTSYFDGDLDDIGFWGRALSSTEVGTVYAGCANLVSNEPIDQKISVGQTANFFCTATNNSTYQWQIDTGTGYFNLNNVGQYTGVKTSYMSVSNLTFANNNHKFRCIINFGVCKDTTIVAKLQVTCGNLIKVEPTDQTNYTGQSVIFSTSTYFDKSATFKWQENNGSGFSNLSDNATYSGTQTRILTISNLKANMNNYTYRCLIAYQSCLDTTATRKVIVKTCPKMVSIQPKNLSIYAGFDALFTLKSNDSLAGLQWQLSSGSGFANISNGGQYTGVTNDSLLVKTLIKQNNNYQYRCILSKAPCTDTSATATLTVLTCGSLIKNQPSNQTVFVGDNALFGLNAIDSAGSTYQWQIFSSGNYFDMKNLGQFSGTTTPILKVSNTTITNDNYKFRCIVSKFPCKDTATSVVLRVQTCPALISQQGSDVANYTDSTVQFKITGNQVGATYQWQIKNGTKYNNLSNGGQYTGVNTQVLSVANLNTTNNNQLYRCFVSYAVCKDSSNAYKLTVLKCASILTTQPSAITKKTAQSASFTVAGGNAQTTYAWQANTGTTFFNIGDTGQYSGAKTTVLTVNKLTLKNNNMTYRCIATATPCSDTSVGGLLTVTDASGINAFIKSNDLMVYPNPANNYLIIKVADQLIGETYTLTNTLGQCVANGTLTQAQLQLNLTGIESGLYYLSVGQTLRSAVNVVR
jgi:hypothetical protein